MAQDKTVILYTFSEMIAANHAKEKLKANGIESFLKNENVMGLDPVSGVELHIFEKDKEAAAKIIAQLI